MTYDRERLISGFVIQTGHKAGKLESIFAYGSPQNHRTWLVHSCKLLAEMKGGYGRKSLKQAQALFVMHSGLQPPLNPTEKGLHSGKADVTIPAARINIGAAASRLPAARAASHDAVPASMSNTISDSLIFISQIFLISFIFRINDVTDVSIMDSPYPYIFSTGIPASTVVWTRFCTECIRESSAEVLLPRALSI